MATITGAEAIWQTLEAEGVENAFGVLGVHLLPLYDALLGHPQLHHYTTRHEQAAAAMADGYARTSGKVGLCLASTGPGALNTLSVQGESYASSVPLLTVASQIPSHLLDQGKGALHESRDQFGAFKAILGNARRVGRVEDIPAAIQEAIRRLRTSRPRPAYLEIPTDILAATAEVEVPAAQVVSRPAGDPASVRTAVETLRRASRPVIWVGGGAVDAGPEILRLAELLDAPVVETTGARGTVPEDHALSLGNRTREGLVKRLLAESDVLLAIGTRFAWYSTGQWTAALPETVIQIDLDPTEIGKNYPVQLGIVGDATLVLRQILGALLPVAGGPATTERTASLVAGIRAEIDGNLRAGGAATELQLMADIREALDRDAIVVCDSAMPTYWARTHLPVFTPRSFVWPIGFGSLGIALPTALGAKVAWPDRQVLTICGDGGFLFTGQELATAVQYGLNVVVLLVNDGGYGILRHMQQTTWAGRNSGVDLANPDFVAFARAFGAEAWRVGVDEVGPALRDAFLAKRPALVEVQAALRPPWNT